MVKRRAGFTFVEVLMVMIVVAILLAIAYPKLAVLRAGSNVASAKQRVAATLTTARQAAISRGVPVKFVLDGNTVAAVAQPYGAADSIQRAFSVSEAYGATLSGDEFELTFDPRGLATGFAEATIVVSYNAKSDTMCVRKLGQIKMGDC
jgi:type IV fimbrial biogenesis protein FimT